MQRASWTLLMVLLLCSQSVAADPGIALLGDLLPWPSAIGPAIPIQLSSAPCEGNIRFSSTGSTAYGCISLGNGNDRIISIAFEGSADPLLWIDANNNENLLDDGPPSFTDRLTLGAYTWVRTVQVSYEDEGIQSEAPYILRISAFKSGTGWDLYGSSFCLRVGLLLTDTALTKIWIGDMNSDGLYSDIENLLIIVDADGDEVPSIDYSIPEYYYPGFPFEIGEFQQASQVFAIERVSPDGMILGTSRALADRAPVPRVLEGVPSPSFNVLTLQGELISSEGFLGREVILFFTPEADSCSTCGNQESQTRLCSIASAIAETGAQMIVVSTTAERPVADCFECGDVTLPLIWDLELLRSFRPRLHWVVIIGPDGTILGKDSVVPIYDSQGRVVGAENQPLHVSEILRLVHDDS